jgi:hypothetical protein
VGSSNLTQTALMLNKEWNTKVISTEMGEYSKAILGEFNKMWSDALCYEDFIEDYTYKFDQIKKQKKIAKQEEIIQFDQYILQPNNMQKNFCQNLSRFVRDGENKALLISATGDRVIIVTGRKSPVKSRTWAA